MNNFDYTRNNIDWKRFRKGHWTLVKPSLPGVYIVAAKNEEYSDGVMCSNHILVYSLEEKICYSHSWGGWWWSEPLPNLPPTPDTLTNSTT